MIVLSTLLPHDIM